MDVATAGAQQDKTTVPVHILCDNGNLLDTENDRPAAPIRNGIYIAHDREDIIATVRRLLGKPQWTPPAAAPTYAREDAQPLGPSWTYRYGGTGRYFQCFLVALPRDDDLLHLVRLRTSVDILLWVYTDHLAAVNKFARLALACGGRADPRHYLDRSDGCWGRYRYAVPAGELLLTSGAVDR